jgi:hypothetical protein
MQSVETYLTAPTAGLYGNRAAITAHKVAIVVCEKLGAHDLRAKLLVRLAEIIDGY